MMECNYRLNGWFGMIVGMKFWIDFRNSYGIEVGVGKLLRELGGRG